MKTANFPRAAVMKVGARSFPFPVTEDDWLISITDEGGQDAKLAYPFAKVLFQKFDDTNDEINGNAIAAYQAAQIAAFIKEARELKKNVWVNCHAGICRSGAVVSLLGDLGWEIVNHPESPGRIPNHLVYTKVRKNFPELTNSWELETDIWVAAKGW
jgi:hypothetical protein